MADLNLNQTLAKSTPSSITPVDDPPKDKPSQYDEVLNQYSQSKPEETILKPEIKTEPESKSNSWAENLPKTEPEIKTDPESIPETPPIKTTPVIEPTPQPEISSSEPAESTPEPEIKTEPVIPEPSIEESVAEPEIQPEITLEPESETFLKPQPEIEVTPEPLYSQKTPDQIKQEISQILDGTSTDSASNIIPPVKSKINIFQILFVLSLIIFLIVVSAVVYFVFFNKTTSDNSDNSVIETITPTPVSSITCTLNDKTYKVGEGFPSADGCNTCSCAQDGSIACTLMACESTKSASKSVTSVVPKDWKTFNSVIGISINAPSNYFLVDASNEKGITTFFSYDSNSNKYPAVGGLPINESKTDLYFTSEKSIDDYINKITSESTKILSQKDLTILGYKAKLIKSNSDVEGSSESMKYVINKNNSIFVAGILLNRNTKQSVKDKFYTDFTKMVESIKFK